MLSKDVRQKLRTKRRGGEPAPKSLRALVQALTLYGEKTLLVAVVIAIVLGSLWFLVLRVDELSQVPKIYQDPSVFNLTQEGILWDVYYGESPRCGDLPCHITAAYPESHFQKKMVLPAREFPLQDYKKGQKIYLRTTVEIPATILSREGPISFHSFYIHASRYRFFINETLIDEGAAETLNISLPKSMVGQDGKIRLAFEIDPGDLSYQGLANRYDLLIGPKHDLNKIEFVAQSKKTTGRLWLILPKLVFCIIFALVFLLFSRSTSIFMFLGYAFFGALAHFLDSGFAAEMMPSVESFQFWKDIAQNAANLLLIGFVYDRFNGASYRTLRWVGAGMILVTLLASALRHMISPAAGIKALDAVYVVSYPAAYILGWHLSRRREGRSLDRLLGWFLLISVAPALLQVWSIISDTLGLGLNPRIPAHRIHELFMFFVLTAFAIMDVSRSMATKDLVERELAVVNERLDLARTVQGMLLPAHLAGQCHGFDYQFFYEPAEKMSGDWMNVWESSEATHLFIGDVVGKGPQAALGVSVIAGVIMDCRLRGVSIDECLARINTQLIALFNKNITTALAVATLTSHGVVELRNAGFFGWVLVKDRVPTPLMLRSSPLGMSEDSVPAKKVIESVQDIQLCVFTDGCLDGPRALKQLMRLLQETPVSGANFDEWHRLIIESGKEHVLVDDKTTLLISSSGHADPDAPHSLSRRPK